MSNRLIKATLLFLALALPVAANPPTGGNHGACIETCFKDNPYSAGCLGTEPTAEVDACTCVGYKNIFSVPAFNCISKCPVSEQKPFFDGVPDGCRAFVLKWYSGPGGSSEVAPASTSKSSSAASSTKATVSTTSAGVVAATVTSASSAAVVATSATSAASTSATAKSDASAALGFNAVNLGVLVGGAALMVL